MVTAAARSGPGRQLRLERDRRAATATPRPRATRPRSPCRCSSTRHGEGCSITGGYVYRGAAIPALQGHYFYADYCRGWVRSFRLQDGQAVEPQQWPTLAPGGTIPSFGQDAAGELYILTAEGRVFRIVPQVAEELGCPRRAPACQRAVRRVVVELPRMARPGLSSGVPGSRAPRRGCWRNMPPFPSSAPSASTPVSTRRPPRRSSASYAEHLPPGFPCVSKVWNQLTVHTFSKAQDKARAGQVNPDFLNPDLFLEAVYEPYQRHFADHAGPFVFEFQAIGRPSGVTPERFADPARRVLRRPAPRGPLRRRDPERGVPHPDVLRRAAGARGGPCLQLLDPHAVHRRAAGSAGRAVGTVHRRPGAAPAGAHLRRGGRRVRALRPDPGSVARRCGATCCG